MIPILLALLALTIAVPTARAQVYETTTGRAAFTGEIPVNSFTGISEALSGRISLIDRSVRFSLPLETLDTGINKRDRDMRRTLQTNHFPDAVFEGTLESDFDPGIPEIQPARVRGTMTIHGVSREVVVDGGLQMTPEGLRTTATWELNMRDYKIDPPRMLVMKVKEAVELRIEALLAPTAAP
jgi:polyisoprenoid-binding protein YceI